MGMKYLGETLDIHGGGEDLIFPHHENEIAQSEAATGKEFCRNWVHNGWVTLGGEKMSKSTLKFRPINEVVETYNPEAIRFYLQSTHYRSPIEFIEERLTEAQTAYSRLRAPLVEMQKRTPVESVGKKDADLKRAAADAREHFTQAMSDDFNTARALGSLFDLSRAMNSGLDAESGTASPGLREAGEALQELGGVLGLFWLPLEDAVDVPQEILDMAKQREEARNNKNFAKADELRDAIDQAGWVIEDRAGETRVKPK